VRDLSHEPTEDVLQALVSVTLRKKDVTTTDILRAFAEARTQASTQSGETA
jgi:hypothetical protein